MTHTHETADFVQKTVCMCASIHPMNKIFVLVDIAAGQQTTQIINIKSHSLCDCFFSLVPCNKN